MTLNELVVAYKTKKDSQTLNKIFGLLSKTIHEKSKFVFYQQKFRAKKFVFKLVDTHQTTIEDVVQELNLFILELINRCDINKPFDKYLYSSIWLWIPKFVNKDFINSLKNISIYKSNENEEEYSILDHVAEMPKTEEVIDLDSLFDGLTDQERQLLKILRKNPEIKQSELADMLQVTQPRVSDLYKSIRNKYKR